MLDCEIMISSPLFLLLITYELYFVAGGLIKELKTLENVANWTSVTLLLYRKTAKLVSTFLSIFCCCCRLHVVSSLLLPPCTKRCPALSFDPYCYDFDPGGDTQLY